MRILNADKTKRIAGLFIILIFMIFIFSGCQKDINIISKASEQMSSQEIFAMDTYMTVTGYGEHSEEAVAEAIELIKALDTMFSTGNENSIVSELNRNKIAKLTPQAGEIMEKALEYGKNTEGAYDITIYPIMRLWGFTDKSFRVPGEQELKEALLQTDYRQVRLEQQSCAVGENQEIDLGGIVKGYTSAQIMEIFKKYELSSGIVSLGGNVQCYRRKADGSKWAVGIRSPLKPDTEGEYLGILNIEDKAVITSGAYERYFTDESTGKKYHHIIDPATGYPAEKGLISVSIVAADGTLADAYSTAVYVMGLDKAAELWRNRDADFDMILMDKNEKVYVTENIASDFLSDFEVEVLVQ